MAMNAPNLMRPATAPLTMVPAVAANTAWYRKSTPIGMPGSVIGAVRPSV
jgi:hypothetical protein